MPGSHHFKFSGRFFVRPSVMYRIFLRLRCDPESRLSEVECTDPFRIPDWVISEGGPYGHSSRLSFDSFFLSYKADKGASPSQATERNKSRCAL